MICVCCWKKAHLKKKGQKCYQVCSVCGLSSHPGEEYRKMYVTMRWMQEHGSNRHGNNMQIRPTYAEIAYLVVAGVFKDWREANGPIIVNMEHPIVKAFYQGKVAPHEILGDRVDAAITKLDIGLKPRAGTDMETRVVQYPNGPRSIRAKETKAAKEEEAKKEKANRRIKRMALKEALRAKQARVEEIKVEMDEIKAELRQDASEDEA
jgi:hypothetical protein